MKSRNRFFYFFILSALVLVALGITPAPVVAAESTVCIPSCSSTDTRMLSLASIGYETLAGQTISIRIAAPGTMSSFQIGIFDGDTGGMWDAGTTSLVYTLYADPLHNGEGLIQLNQWLGSNMFDNAWTDMTIAQDARAIAPSGDYFYQIKVNLPDAETTKTWSNFKIRSDAPIELAVGESFSYAAMLLSVADAKVVYPQYPTQTPSTYDGVWDMYVNVPVSTSRFIVYDGDMDYGSFDCSVNDTNDPDTPDDVLPAWAIGISDMPENVATATINCRNSARQPITGPQGQVYTTGNPADDNVYTIYTRSPSVTYSIIDPNGNVYHNANPSGTREWEQFLIESDPSVPADYYTNGLLPAGMYHVQITGLDLTNLNAWHFNYDQVCVYEDGTPCTPLLHPYKIGDAVWNDTNSNGIQDDGESGIAGVTVTLLDVNGNPIPNGTATTDANGNYFFGVDAGTYSVQVDSNNFETGGALAGYFSTTPGENVQTNTVTTDNVLTYDFGYGRFAAVGDFVWNDLNGNGTQEDGEPGIAGVTVNLLGSDGASMIASTTTDTSGSYNFSDLLPGTYYVQVLAPAETTFTIANAGGDDAKDSDVNVIGRTAAITVSIGETNNSVDAGLKESLSLSCPNNLVKNPSFELNTGTPPKYWTNGMAGHINIPAVDGRNVAYITGSKIMYQKVSVTPGNTYTLTFYSGSHNPSIQTVKIQYYTRKGSAIGTAATHIITSDLEVAGFGGPYSLTLDAAPANAAYMKIMVSANKRDYAKVDKLCLQTETPPATASIGDFVWNDLNGNGIQDDNESGLAGITVKLLGGDGTTVVATTTTDTAGNYSFASLLPGTYYVKFVAPAEKTFATVNAGSDDARDSDADAAGKTAAITLSVGETNNSVDAGLKDASSSYCPGNLVLNPSFELNTGTPPKYWTNGTAGPINVPVVDGRNAAYISGSGSMYQKIDVITGNSYTLTFYSGSHNPSIQTVKLQYYDANHSTIGTAATHVITSDLEISGFGGPYSLTLDAAPSNAAFLKILVSANNKDYAKVDKLCLQPAEPPAEVNYCGYVRSPGFWKNYSNHMSDTAFQDLVAHTQDFGNLTVSQAYTILRTNNGATSIGVPELDGVDASYLKFLLSSELNATWNGQEAAADPGSTLGSGSYQGTGMTVDQVLHQAYVDRYNFSSAQKGYLEYLGAGGENVRQNACLVQP